MNVVRSRDERDATYGFGQAIRKLEELLSTKITIQKQRKEFCRGKEPLASYNMSEKRIIWQESCPLDSDQRGLVEAAFKSSRPVAASGGA